MTVADPTQALLESVPVLDLARPEQDNVATVRKACLESGFFYLKVANSGITDELLAAMFSRSRAFFELPMGDKMAIHINSHNRGYTRLDEETLDPAVQKKPDSKEGMYIGRQVDPSEYNKPLHGPNQFPDEALVPGFKQTMLAYYAAALGCVHKLNRLLALSLDLAADFFDKDFTAPLASLRPLHYTPSISKPDEGTFAAGAHTDYGMVTVLATDLTPGLQVNIGGTWVDIPPKQDHLIVNLGDLLHRWTNGKYKSALHRVVTTSGKHRYSTAYFVEPNFDSVVSPLPTCCSPDNPARWPPVTSGEYLMSKYRQTQATFAEREQQTAKKLCPPVSPEGPPSAVRAGVTVA